MQSRSPFMIRGARAFAAAAVGVLMLAAAGQALASECRVRFTQILHEPYQSGGRQMHRLVLIGDHNFSVASNTGGAATTGFRIVDSDGFLTFAILTTRWSESGTRIVADSAGEVRVSRAELETLRYAMEMGRAYYSRIVEIMAIEPRPANSAEVNARATEKQALISEVLSVLGAARGYRASDDTWIVNNARLRQQLARFDATGNMRSQYRDFLLNDGAPNLLCSSTAANPVIGVLACAGTSNALGRATCPDGVVFTALEARRPAA